MKMLIVVILVAVAIIGSFFVFSEPISKERSTAKLTFSGVQKEATEGAKLYDVRTAEEYNDGHYEGAVNWSLQDIQAGRLPNIPKNTRIYVYCNSGNRSSQAASLLRNAGFEDVIDLRGLADVKSMGGTLTTKEEEL